MSRRQYQFTERKFQKYIAEGRGTGEAELYEPWLKVYDLPSKGRSHRIWGVKTRRIHHFLSDGEWKCFLGFEADDSVVDIREQFPLDRHQTYQIARDLGYRHPTTTDGTPYVLTIDFLITRILSDAIQLEGYSFKYQPNTLTERNWELHRIAEEFLSRSSIRLHMLDETNFNENFIKNYDSVRLWFDLSSDTRFTREQLRASAQALLRRRANSNQTLAEACGDIARQEDGITAQGVFDVARHLIARGVFRVDLGNVADIADMRMSDLHLNSELLRQW